MNTFLILLGLLLYGLTFLCFYIPYKNGQEKTGNIAGLTLALLITLTFIANLDFLVIFIWPTIIIFQLIFLTYWAFAAFKRKVAGKLIASVLTIAFLFMIMQPWVSDWRFSKKDAIKTLSLHNIEIKDDFEIVTNEAGGFRDYYETFTLKLSENDFNRLSNTIRTSKNYKGLFTDYPSIAVVDFKATDTVDYETDTHIEREYRTGTKMENGTYHFRFQLDKQRIELSYIGSDE